MSCLEQCGFSHTQAIHVTTDLNTGSTAAAMITAGVPAYGDHHPAASTCTVSSVEAELVNDSSNHFEVTVEYAIAEGTGAMVDNPLQRPPEVS